MGVVRTMFRKDMASAQIDAESRETKKYILIFALVNACICLIFGSLYLSRFDAAMTIQERAEIRDGHPIYKGPAADRIMYDTLSCAGPYSDPETVHEISISMDCDSDCRKEGSRWSHVFLSNGLLMMMLMTNLLCVSCGVQSVICR